MPVGIALSAPVLLALAGCGRSDAARQDAVSVQLETVDQLRRQRAVAAGMKLSDDAYTAVRTDALEKRVNDLELQVETLKAELNKKQIAAYVADTDPALMGDTGAAAPEAGASQTRSSSVTRTLQER